MKDVLGVEYFDRLGISDYSLARERRCISKRSLGLHEPACSKQWN
jgi:hypothetical protein